MLSNPKIALISCILLPEICYNLFHFISTFTNPMFFFHFFVQIEKTAQNSAGHSALAGLFRFPICSILFPVFLILVKEFSSLRAPIKALVHSYRFLRNTFPSPSEIPNADIACSADK